MEEYTCRYVAIKGPTKGQRCTVRPRNGQFCSKHSATKIASEAIQPIAPVDADEILETIKDKKQVVLLADPVLGNQAAPEPNDEVHLGGGKRKRERTPKLKSTVVMVTLNSNKPLASMSAEDKKAFKEMAAQIFSKDVIPEFLSDRTHDDPKEVIKDIESSYHFEVSGADLLHLHGLIKIVHTGFLKWHANRVRDLAVKMLGHNVYLNTPISSDPILAWKQYTEKAQGAVTF